MSLENEDDENPDTKAYSIFSVSGNVEPYSFTTRLFRAFERLESERVSVSSTYSSPRPQSGLLNLIQRSVTCVVQQVSEALSPSSTFEVTGQAIARSISIDSIGASEPSEPRSIFYCHICMENADEQTAFSMSNCKEGHKFCSNCIEGYLSNVIQEGSVDKIACPLLGDGECGGYAGEDEIKSIVSKDLVYRYIRLREMRSDQNARECPKCGKIQIGDPSHPAMVCADTNCQVVFCFFHSDAHPDETCEEYRRRTIKNEKSTQRYLKHHSKPCPKCKISTQKSGGCNHMTCRSCQQDWCWLCGRVYTPNHYDLNNPEGCPGQQFSAESSSDCGSLCCNLNCRRHVNVRMSPCAGREWGGQCIGSCYCCLYLLLIHLLAAGTAIEPIWRASYNLLLELGFLFCAIIAATITTLVVVPMVSITLLLEKILFPRYEYDVIKMRYHEERLVELTNTEMALRGQYRVCSACGKTDVMKFCCRKYCGFSLCTDCYEYEKRNLYSTTPPLSHLHVPMYKNGKPKASTVPFSPECFLYRQALDGPADRAVEEYDIERAQTLLTTNNSVFKTELIGGWKFCFTQRQRFDFWEIVYNLHLWVFVISLFTFPVPVMIFYFLVSLVVQCIVAIPVVFYGWTVKCFCFFSTGCWIRNFIRRSLRENWEYIVGHPLEFFFFRLTEFSQRNEMGLSKLFRQVIFFACLYLTASIIFDLLRRSFGESQYSGSFGHMAIFLIPHNSIILLVIWEVRSYWNSIYTFTLNNRVYGYVSTFASIFAS